MLWRLGIVLLGFVSICAGAVSAVLLWVLFGFPMEPRKSDAGAPGLQAAAANSASLGRSGPPNAVPQVEAPIRPAACTGGEPWLCQPGSSSPGAAEPEKAVKEAKTEARAGSDQPQPQPTRTESPDRGAATPPAGQQQISGTSATNPGSRTQCSADLCSARYKSFNASDCTYQPYGGGPRALCELGAQSAEATSPPSRPASEPNSEAKDTRSEAKDTRFAALMQGLTKSVTPAGAAAQCNAALCGATYKSFNAADCTYQPHGGGPRSLCELGTNSVGASPQSLHAATESSPASTGTRLTEATQEPPKSTIPVRAAAQCNPSLCAATYSSFNAADCTYQPYGGGPRSICDLSKGSGEAPRQPVRAAANTRTSRDWAESRDPRDTISQVGDMPISVIEQEPE